jgi:predicted nucleotidyltransferase
MHKAFITGSHAYGVPTPESDVDVVVFMSEFDVVLLGELLMPDSDYGGMVNISVKCGPLNLIACSDADLFETWRRGTEELKSRGPVTRDEAVIHLSKLRDSLLGSL